MSTQPTTLPAEVVINLLDAHASLTKGTNLFSCAPKPESKDGLIPRNCVFCWSQFSFMPTTYIGVRKNDRQFLVDTLIRYQEPFATGRLLAFNAWELLQCADVSSYTNYISCTLRDSEPRYIGVDDADNHRWIFTTNLRYVG